MLIGPFKQTGVGGSWRATGTKHKDCNITANKNVCWMSFVTKLCEY